MILLFRIVFVIALALLFFLALIPAPDIVQFVSWQDKIEHAAAFAALSVLGWLGWPRHVWRIAVGLLFYGALMELAQGLTADRFADFYDWIADAVGVAILIPLTRYGAHLHPYSRLRQS